MLKGVNYCHYILKKLMHLLVKMRVRPYFYINVICQQELSIFVLLLQRELKLWNY